MDNMTTVETVTSEQILALRDEAGCAGDQQMREICLEALAGDEMALRACVQAIRSARGDGVVPHYAVSGG